jgi:precorrin-2/cobalt-factor-2 C20-methyltransferase
MTNADEGSNINTGKTGRIGDISHTGTLYGIGVGPGDPELMPIKAVRILQSVDVVFAASSSRNDYSRAVEIARPFLPDAARVRMLGFPMSRDPAEKARAWDAHARTILQALKDGLDAAFLTLGDPLTYATYGYVIRSLKGMAPTLSPVTIPGITSFQAAAARINLPLVEGEESLVLVSGADGGRRIRQLSSGAQNMVILKAYKHTEDITAALEESGMLASSVGVANCSMENEEIIEDLRTLKEKPPGYWTLIIAKKNGSGEGQCP